MISKIKQKILESSGSYNHLKKENKSLKKDMVQKLKKEESLISELSKKVDNLSKQNDENEKVLDSYYNYFENIYLNHELVPIGVWAKLQLLEQELLTFVDNVCAKYDLEYWLDYGTLIGAVRHGGFVPWDDDVDIGMMRKDFEKIYPILEKELKLNQLDKDIDLRLYHENFHHNIMPFIQFTYRYPNFGITMSNIDVFPYDFRESKEGIDEDLYYSERYRLHDRFNDRENPKEIIADYCKKLDLVYDESDYIVPGGEAPRGANQYKFDIMEKDVIFPLKTVKFKDRYFKCPNDYDNHLKRIYGDYTQIPKILHHHNLVKVLKTVEDIDNQFDIAIEKMKIANENFK